jgi:hypothetical protein
VSRDPSKVYTIYRLEVPLVSQTISSGSSSGNATGLADLVLIDVIAFKRKWGLAGIGPALIIPTASPAIYGSGKWSAGLAGVILYTKIPRLQIGALAQQYFSFAGDAERESVNFMFFQPILNKILSKGYFLQFSPIMKFDWENSDYIIPLSIGFGRAFAKNLSMSIAPEYIVAGSSKDTFSVKLNVNLMFAPV